MPPCHPYTNFFGIVIVSGSLACFCFDLDEVFLQGATTPPLHQNFLNCHYFGKWTLCLLQISQCIYSRCHHAIPTPFFYNGHCGKAALFLLRLSHGISSGCHHATPKPFCICHYCGKATLCFCFDLAKVFLQGATMPPYTKFFSGFVFIAGRGHYASAPT